MLDGMKFAEQGMIQMSMKQDIMTNNLANASTFGYRKEGLQINSFSEVMQQQGGIMDSDGSGDANQVYMKRGDGNVSVGQQLISSTTTSYEQGSARQTDNQFDLMLNDNGHGFFAVKTPDGERYTRNGNFKLQDGYLTTADGSRVQGLKGDIKLGGTNFEVTGDGYVKMDGKTMDRLKVCMFLNPNELSKEGATNLKAPEGKALVLDKGISVKQGYLEMANVNTVQEMIDITSISRAYEANQKVLQSEDHILQKAADIGKVH